MEEEVVVRAGVKRSEEGDTLNVVPMEMGEKDVRVNGTVLVFLDQLLAQIAEAGAAVENIDLPVDADLNAGGIASISQIFELGSGSGSPDAPEFHQHELLPRYTLQPIPVIAREKVSPYVNTVVLS